MDNLQCTSKEWNTFREYRNDGHLELFIGIGMMACAIGGYWHCEMEILMIVLGLIAIPALLWHRIVVMPRRGHVEFHPALIHQLYRRLWWAIAGFVGTVVLTVIVLHQLRDRIPHWFAGTEPVMTIFLGLIFTFVMLGGAFVTQVKRHYVIAAVNVIVWWTVLQWNLDQLWVFAALGVLLTTIGGTLVILFFRRYPKHPAAVQEPVSPSVDQAFTARTEYEQAIYRHYLATGAEEFLIACGYCLIPLLLGSFDLPLFWMLIWSLLLPFGWKSWATYFRMNTEQLHIARAVEKRNTSPLFNMVLMFPLILLMNQPHNSLSGSSMQFHTYFDLIVIGYCAIVQTAINYFERVVRFSPLLLGSVVLYLILRVTPLPQPTVAWITAIYPLTLGIYRATRFIRKPLQLEPPIQTAEGTVQ